ncbi:MAG: MASE1 domain-containing protein [Sphingomicrobium sp.]
MPTLPSLTPRHDRVPAAASGRPDLPWPLLTTILITALACGLLAYVSIVYTRGSGRIAAVWLPNALLLAVVAGRRGLPIVAWLGPAFIANLIANIAVGDSLAMAVGLSLANTIEVAIALFALGKLKAQRPDMTSLADLMRFCAIGGIVAPACSAAVAVVILWPGSFAPAVMLWASWATTDGLGIMLFSPTLWIVADAWADRSRPSRATVLNWVAVTAFGTCVSLIVFTQHTAPLLFLMMPVVFLYAYRLGVLGTAVSILEISIIASIATPTTRARSILSPAT